MKTRKLGGTGVMMSELTLGSNTFGGGTRSVWRTLGALGQDDVNSIVGRAFEAGINSFDTADIYGAGESEGLLGTALAALGVPRSAYLLTTKVGMRTGPGPNDVGLSRIHVLAAADASLARLGTDYIDIYMVHAFDPLTPLEETLEALDLLVRSGKVRYIGCSNLAAWQIMKALGISARAALARFEIIECRYSAGTREVEREILPLACDQGLAVIAWAPLANGILTGKHQRDGAGAAGTRLALGRFAAHERPHERARLFDVLDAMQPVARKHGVPVARIALAWVLHQPSVTSIAFGVTRVEQLEDNLLACDILLDAGDLAAIDEAGRPPEEYPAWMLTRPRESKTG